ncbi:putative GNAT family acetyltransferase [Microdochium trichocladiopsis]|uniref:GNAT family acetyltransferase n=1 Tax=Microdochium trichocladiopsis TaxID=1682393 RepID=A0A9P8YH94_9PEZI|nr:putative GNAT family acetyltransferase [Microdochium trichocladiopsis]KAH7037929.1 putative GNAT family acetyltransferase [Microdochium trichocladiopsis]
MGNSRPFNPFTSQRLVYRAVRDTPEDEAFVHAIQADAEAQSGAMYGLLRPETLKSSNEFKAEVAEKCLLGAIICLPAAASGDPENNNNDTTTNLSTNTSSTALYKDKHNAMAGTPIGIICLKANPPRFAQHRWSEISIDVLAEHRGKGYGAEAIEWSLWYGFRMAGLHRIQIQAFSFNDGACRLYGEKLGFKEEGRQRDHVWFDGGWHDNVIYGMLEDEWRATRDGQAQK